MRVHLPVLPPRSADLVRLEPFALPPEPYVPGDVSELDLSGRDLAARSQLRTSSYTIYVDLPGNTDDMLLVHGYTGAYDRVSKRVATYLRSLEPRHPPKPLYGDWTPETNPAGEVFEPSEQTIDVLRRRGYLVPLSPEEEEALFVKLASRHHLARIRSNPGYVIMPTYQCNLRCPYCYQDHMRTDQGLSHLLQVMDRTMADRILVGMDRIDAAHGLAAGERERAITFYGGEPLLPECAPIIEYLIDRIRRDSQANFTAVSNATELHTCCHLLGKDAISAVQITLDGPPEEHDQRRIHADGSGTFARIADNIDLALERGVKVSVRINVDRDNIARMPRVAEFLHRRGWTEHGGFNAYVAPVQAGNGKIDPQRTFNNWQLSRAMQDLRGEHPALAATGIADDQIRARARAIFARRDGAQKPEFRSEFCGAHANMYVIDSFADIYACWELTGDPEIRIGHIAETGEVWMNRRIMEHWRGRNVVSNNVCRKCRYATACGGGCAVLADQASGDAYRNYCDGFAKRFRAKIAQAYTDFEQGTGGPPAPDSLCNV